MQLRTRNITVKDTIHMTNGLVVKRQVHYQEGLSASTNEILGVSIFLLKYLL